MSGWQAHSIRGFLSGRLKKPGLVIVGTLINRIPNCGPSIPSAVGLSRLFVDSDQRASVGNGASLLDKAWFLASTF